MTTIASFGFKNSHSKSVCFTGGGPSARSKHEARKKLFVRDRIETVVDPGTAFLELSPLAAHELYGKDKVPAGGSIKIYLIFICFALIAP